MIWRAMHWNLYESAWICMNLHDVSRTCAAASSCAGSAASAALSMVFPDGDHVPTPFGALQNLLPMHVVPSGAICCCAAICSTFLSAAWDVPKPANTSTLERYATAQNKLVSRESIIPLQNSNAVLLSCFKQTRWATQSQWVKHLLWLQSFHSNTSNELITLAQLRHHIFQSSQTCQEWSVCKDMQMDV